MNLRTRENLTSKKFTQLRRGLLEFAVLRIIDAARPSFSIQEIHQALSRTEFKTSEGTLYPLLARLSKEKLVTKGWEESDIGNPRKFYYLTTDGKKTLLELKKYWKTVSDILTDFEKTNQNDNIQTAL